MLFRSRFIGEKDLKLEGGSGAFYVAGKYQRTGKIQCSVSAEGVKGASCEIIVDMHTEK